MDDYERSGHTKYSPKVYLIIFTEYRKRLFTGMMAGGIKSIWLFCLCILLSGPPCQAKTFKKVCSVTKGSSIVLNLKNSSEPVSVSSWKQRGTHIKVHKLSDTRYKVKGVSYGSSFVVCEMGKDRFVFKILVDDPVVKLPKRLTEGSVYQCKIKNVHKQSDISFKGSSGMKIVRSFYKKGKRGCWVYRLRPVDYGSVKLRFFVNRKCYRKSVRIKHICKNRVYYVKRRRLPSYNEMMKYCSVCDRRLEVIKSHKTGVIYPDMVDDDSELYGDIIIGNGVKTIPDSFCCDNQKITSIVIPSSVRTIRDYAFSDCKNLKSIKFKGNGLTSIGYGVCNSCPSLEVFPVLPDSLEYLGDHAFCHCPKAAFPDGVFRIPSHLKLLGSKTVCWNGKLLKNDGFSATHIFYDCSSSEKPLKKFVGESTSYIAIDGVLYRKRSVGDKTPVFLISIPPGKKYFNSFGQGTGRKTGIYVMPNTVLSAAELSFNAGNHFLEGVVFSDVFRINQRPSDFQKATYNVTMLYDKTAYANMTTLLGGHGDKNLSGYSVRNSNPLYSSYKGCIYSKDYSSLWSVPPCLSDIVLHDKCSKVDSGALQQAFFGTPVNPNTGDGYLKWVQDLKAAVPYDTQKVSRFVYNENSLKFLSKSWSDMSIQERIVYHVIKHILPNSEANFRIILKKGE